MIARAGGQAEIAPEKLWRDPVAFGRWVGDIKTQFPVRALVHLGPLDDPAMPDDVTLEDWQARAHRDVQALFAALQTCADDLQHGGTVIAASAMGGLFARAPQPDGSAPWPHAAGNIGLVKSLTFEWEKCRSKAVDLDPSEDTQTKAGHLFRELFLGCGRREVGYPAGRRTVFRTEPAFLRSVADKDREPNGKWVVLAIGGGLGVTAETLRDAARVGARLILVGRRSLPEPEPAELAAAADVAALRRHFIAAAAQTRLTPREIDAKVAAVLRARELRANIADLERLGGQVEYRSADMCDPTQADALVAGLYQRHGRIDAVYFGIGLIEDQLLVNKKPASIARVMATKIDSAFLLSRLLRADTLKFFGFFTSVAGRYGNRGQTDYAAANEILNQFAWILQRRWGPAVKVAAVNWGPWAGTTNGSGMVTPEVRAQFEARGVSLVEPEEGLAFLTRELIYGPVDEVETVAGNNPWEHLEAGFDPLPPLPGAQRPERPLALLMPAALTVESETAIVVRKRIDLVNDPYLDHHRLDTAPVMPFAVAAEHMAEAASLFDPHLVVGELRDVRMLTGITLNHGSLDLEIRARRNGDEVAVECWLPGDKPRAAYRATAVLAARLPEGEPATRMARNGPPPVEMRQAYDDWLFHGPLFQTLTGIELLNESHLVLSAQPSLPRAFYPPADTAQWLFDPGVVDGALQALLVWARAMRDETPLPHGIGRLMRFGTAPLSGPLRILVRFETPPHESHTQCSIEISDDSGTVRIRMLDVSVSSAARLNRIGGGWTGRRSVGGIYE